MACKSALLLDYHWCMEILEGRKTWEIRNKACHKRERIALACTGKTSPTGQCLLMGEVDVTNCLVVGCKRGMFVSAPEESNNYMFLKQNVKKHQIKKVCDFPILKSYETIFAWVVANPELCAIPKELAVKPGCVVWATIA